MGKRELLFFILPNLSSWCLVMIEWLFVVVPCGCLWFVIVVFPDHPHLLFLTVVALKYCSTDNAYFIEYIHCGGLEIT